MDNDICALRPAKLATSKEKLNAPKPDKKTPKNEQVDNTGNVVLGFWFKRT